MQTFTRTKTTFANRLCRLSKIFAPKQTFRFRHTKKQNQCSALVFWCVRFCAILWIPTHLINNKFTKMHVIKSHFCPFLDVFKVIFSHSITPLDNTKTRQKSLNCPMLCLFICYFDFKALKLQKKRDSYFSFFVPSPIIKKNINTIGKHTINNIFVNVSLVCAFCCAFRFCSFSCSCSSKCVILQTIYFQQDVF